MKRICGANLDIISGLPSCIIENILVCLPLPDAVRTSVLSKKWRYKWVTLPQLSFDPLIFPEILPYELRPPSPSSKHKLVTIIYKVLLRHSGPIVKFFLSHQSLESCFDINDWILFLCSNHIRDFTLRIWRGEKHNLPVHFYSFIQLRHLDLSSCVFKPPSTFKGFSRLISISFDNVIIATDMFGNFISNCPLLERLDLSGCRRFECLEIDAPHLKFFQFNGVFKSICFKSAPCLVTMNIDLCTMANNVDLVEGETSNMIKVFGRTTVVQNLHVHEKFLKFLSVGNVQKKLPITTFQHLKFLYFDVCFQKINEISCTLSIIRSSPNLETLEIFALTDPYASMDPAVEYLQTQDFSSCSLNQFRNVNMLHIAGVEPELEFMKLLLANLTALVNFCFVPSEDYVTDGGLQILKELIRFPRVSPIAEILCPF